ncbi:AraC family transcriptional regulator [Mucilaginibacter sp.]
MLSPDNSVKNVTYLLNFESLSYFSRLFKIKTGLTPQEYRSIGLKKYGN